MKRSEMDKGGAERQRTVGILTALPEHELPAALRALGIASDSSPHDRFEGERYWLATVKRTDGKELRVVISCFGLSGNTESQLPVDRLIRRFKPELVILAGIACGIRKFSLGDVVTSDLMWAYEYVKTTAGKELDRSRGKVTPRHIQDDVQFFKATKMWHKAFASAQTALSGTARPRTPCTRPVLRQSVWIASGEKVMANGELPALNAKHDLIQAGEMEGYGFAAACEDRRPPVPWLVVRGISDYGDKTKDKPRTAIAPRKDEYHPTAANAATSFVKVFLENAYTLATEHIQKSASVTAGLEAVGQALVSELRRLASQGNYETILRYRDTFSRFLWLEGKAKERVRLGEIAEDAAAKLGNKQVRIAALVDDIGWSLMSLGQLAKAQTALLHGLRLAKELREQYWISKAYRHLAGSYLEAKDYGNAWKYLGLASKAAAKILDADARAEMLAGIEYGRAVTAHLTNKLDDALKYIETSDRLRKKLGDASRMVRTYNMKGKIAEAIGDAGLAKDLYRTGLNESLKIRRKDEMIRNHLGLARVYAREGSSKLAQKHALEARKLLTGTPVPFEPGDTDSGLRNN